MTFIGQTYNVYGLILFDQRRMVFENKLKNFQIWKGHVQCILIAERIIHFDIAKIILETWSK